MVCNRCIAAVGKLLSDFRLDADVELGSAEVKSTISPTTLSQIKSRLEQLGFELLDDKESALVEKVKNLVVDLIHSKDNQFSGNLSDYISSEIPKDYGTVSQLFSQTQGTTIEQFYILQKTERVKELLSYGEENLNEIADRLNYSSPSHLSRQFKSVTGMTPSEFRKTHPAHRTALDKL